MCCVVSVRSCEGRVGGGELHAGHVCESEPLRAEDHLLALHVCHRHREHPLRVRRRQRHHPTDQPAGVQPRVV